MLYSSESYVNMAHKKAVICDEGPVFTSDLMKMYFHAMKCKAILHFSYESWVK